MKNVLISYSINGLFIANSKKIFVLLEEEDWKNWRPKYNRKISNQGLFSSVTKCHVKNVKKNIYLLASQWESALSAIECINYCAGWAIIENVMFTKFDAIR